MDDVKITAEMTRTVDKLIATNFENATPEEIQMYSDFNVARAKHAEELQARREVLKQESDERNELIRQQAESAMNALDALTELAQAKLKAVENGQA